MDNSLFALLEVSLFVGLLYAPITIGLALSFRLLNYPDLTCEGSFMLGGAASLVALQSSSMSWLSLPLAFVIGSLAGTLTSFLHSHLRVSRLLSGIITTAIAYSLTIRFFGGKANAKTTQDTIFSYLNPGQSDFIDLCIAGGFVFLVLIAIIILYRLRIGRMLYALGDHEKFVMAIGRNPKTLLAIGLAIGNGIIGLCGGLIGHHKSVFDVNMSFGILIGGIASLVIGETIYASKRLWQHIMMCVVGTWMYNFAIGALYFKWNIPLESYLYPSDVRMVAGLLLIVPAIILRNARGRYRLFTSEW